MSAGGQKTANRDRFTIFEERAPGLYHNTAVVFDKDGRIAGRYRKMHIPDDPGFYEKYYFTPGDLGFTPIETSIGKLGVLICWDQWYPEGARLMALAGAELLIYPTAIGWDPHDTQEEQQRQLHAWITIQRARMPVANGNPGHCMHRIGFEQAPDLEPGVGINFWGTQLHRRRPKVTFMDSANESEVKVLTTTDRSGA